MPFIVTVIIGIIVVLRIVLKAVNSANAPSKGVQNSIQQRQFSGGVIHQPSTNQGVPQPQQDKLPENMSLEDFVNYMRQKSNPVQSQPVAPPIVEEVKHKSLEARERKLKMEQLEFNRKKADLITDEVEENRKSHYSEEELGENYVKRHDQGLGVQHHQHKFGHAHEAAYEKGAKNDAYDLPAGNVRGSRLGNLVGSKNNFRKFMLLKEVMDRKDYW